MQIHAWSRLWQWPLTCGWYNEDKAEKRLNITKTAPKLQLNMLENDEMMNKYSISVKNKFSALGQLTTAEERWQLMIESMLESAKEHTPVTKRKVDPMEERWKVKADEEKYRELYKQVKKRCNEAKEHWIKAQCGEIEANTGVNSKTVHQKIKEVTLKKKRQQKKTRVHMIKR